MSVERETVEQIARDWDAEPDGVWEPKVGDRVVVQWRSDCGDTGLSHAQHVYGREGIVSYVRPAGLSASQHDVCVEYDTPIIVNALNGSVTVQVVAPYRRDELTPISADDDAGEAGR